MSQKRRHWYVLTNDLGVLLDYDRLTHDEAERRNRYEMATAHDDRLWLTCWQCCEAVPRAAVESLKQLWLHDPFWDLEELEGYESVRKELYYFRLAKEYEWLVQAWYESVLLKVAVLLPISQFFVEFYDIQKCVEQTYHKRMQTGWEIWPVLN